MRAPIVLYAGAESLTSPADVIAGDGLWKGVLTHPAGFLVWHCPHGHARPDLATDCAAAELAARRGS